MWRTLDVGAVVGSLPLADAVVAAGADGMARTITRARPAPTAEHLSGIAAGELLVTTTAALLGTEQSAGEVFARLDAAGVAGLAVRLESDEVLPNAAVAAADALGLPVLTFAGPTLADVTAAVLDALLEAQRKRLQRVLDIHHRFAEVVAAGGGARELAATLHEVLGRPVAVVDSEGRPSVVVPPDAAIDLEPDATTTTRQPIAAGEQLYGAVVADTSEAALDADGAVAMERAALGIAVRLAQASAVTEAQERFAALSLEELISGHGGTATEVLERSVTFGWDLGRPRAVLLASIDPPEDGPIPANALSTVAAAARATLGRDAIVWTRSATIAALVAPETDDPAERRRIAEGLRAELDDRLRSVNVSIGVGRRVDSPTLLPRSFMEASRAVDVGRWAKGRHVTEVFDQLGLERLLASTPTDDLAEFVQHAIGPLVAHDRAHNTDLVETLSAWLETRNMAEAARRMYVHYNTLKNRLDRIEAIIGSVVDDAARALECEVAIYVARHYEVSWDERPGAM